MLRIICSRIGKSAILICGHRTNLKNNQIYAKCNECKKHDLKLIKIKGLYYLYKSLKLTHKECIEKINMKAEQQNINFNETIVLHNEILCCSCKDKSCVKEVGTNSLELDFFDKFFNKLKACCKKV